MSGWLLHCAECELIYALEDRGPGKASSPHNHWSPHSAASILLLVAALEAWLNESTLLLGAHHADLRKLANCTVRQKYRGIAEDVGGSPLQVSPDLDLVLRIRDEIAHFLPLVLTDGVPPWLTELQNRDLFITSAKRQPDYDFAVKLNSYALAYWAWETVHVAARDFTDALGPVGSALSRTIGNFEGYQSVCPPGRLPEYDAKNMWRRRLSRLFGRLRVGG